MSNSGLSYIMFFFLMKGARSEDIFLKSLIWECSVMNETLNKTHVHVCSGYTCTSTWRSSTMECKKNKWELPPPSHFKLLILYSIHKTCGINLFTTAVKCSLFCTVLIFKHKQCIMGAGWVGDTSDRLQYVTHVIERVMGRQWMTGMVV